MGGCDAGFPMMESLALFGHSQGRGHYQLFIYSEIGMARNKLWNRTALKAQGGEVGLVVETGICLVDLRLRLL